MYLLFVFYTGNGSRPPWSALPQHLPAFHHGSGQWHQPKEQEQRLRWLILKQLVLLNCQAAKIRPVARSPRWSLAVWKVHVFCLWVLNFSFVFGFIEVLRENMLAYIGHCCLCFELFHGNALACNWLFGCLPFTKCLRFRVVSKENFQEQRNI